MTSKARKGKAMTTKRTYVVFWRFAPGPNSIYPFKSERSADRFVFKIRAQGGTAWAEVA